MKIRKFLASDFAALDSNVYTGGGTDDTEALQRVLDMAKDGDGVWLVMDGAALVRGLKLYSNTTIECLSKDCGFFLADHANCAVVTNAIWDDYELKTRNVKLIGGTYNQDCLNQDPFVLGDKIMFAGGTHYEAHNRKYTFGLEFYGIEHLLVRDVTIRNFKKYAFAVGGFRNVTIEDCWLELPDHRNANNQDGFHFWGPGRFLTVRNVGGRVGDDFMNLGPDERDKVSSITDVLVDGVFLDDADQALRLLTRDKGRLDRVTIRNVIGTYRSFGFFINPWFLDETMGNFGHIFIENVELKSMEPNYTYRKPILFSLGGNIESIIMKNVRSHGEHDARALFEIGSVYHDPLCEQQKAYGDRQKLGTIVIEDLFVTANADEPQDTHYITVCEKVDRLMLKNVKIFKEQEPNGMLIDLFDRGQIDTLLMENVYTEGVAVEVNCPERVGKTVKL